VKIMTAESFADPLVMEGFRTEVRAVARLRHPGIVRVFDQGVVDARARRASGGLLEEGSPYLVMELATGGTMPLRARSRPELLDSLIQVLDALAHAHARGVIHRDLKPANVLVQADGALKLTDFGAAYRIGERGAEGFDESVVGTFLYMPPEQIEGRVRDQGPWTDLYAVGCMAWRSATGEHAFAAPTTEGVVEGQLVRDPPRFEPALPFRSGFEAWLRRLLEKDPARRFRRAAEARAALLGVEAGDPGAVARRGAPPLPAELEIVDPSPAEAPLEGVALHGLRVPPLLGRARAQEALWARLRAVASSGRQEAVIIRGEIGRGKTRLVEWLAERSHEVGATIVLRARHEEHGGLGHGLGPLTADFLETAGLNRIEVAARIAELLPRLGLPAEDARAYVELVLPRSEDERAGGAVGVEFASPSERWALVRRLVDAASVRRTVLLVVEDAQWAPDALGLALDLLQSRSEVPVLLVVTARPPTPGLAADRFETLEAHPAATVLRLGLLDQDAMEALAVGHLRLGALLCAEVLRRAQGNPMYAVSTVDDWVARGLLVDGADGLLTIRPDVSLDAAHDLATLCRPFLDRTLAGRPAAERVALELAACLGVQVDRDEWTSVCAAARIGPGDVLATLLDAGLASDDGHRWRFENVLVRAAGLASAASAGRTRAHNRIVAGVLDARGVPGARVAEHLFAAGEFAAAANRLEAAAVRLLELGEFHQVTEVERRRSEMLDADGASAGDPRRDVGLLLLVRAHRQLGGDRRRELIERLTARHSVEARPDRVAAQVLWERARMLHDEGFVPGEGELPAAAVAEQAVALAERTGDAVLLANARCELASILGDGGDSAYAEALLRTAIATLDEHGLEEEKTAAQQTLFFVLRSQGRGEEMLEMLERRIRLAEAAGHRKRLAGDRNSLGELCRDRGDLRAAQRHYEAAAMLYSTLGVEAGAAVMRLNLGQVLLEREQWGEARKIVRRAVATLIALGRGGLAPAGEIIACAASAGLRDWPAFDRHLEAAASGSRETGFLEPDLATCARRAGDLAQSAREPRRARRAWRLAADQWRGMGRMAEALTIERLLG
jgi:tetratricopeptide (TPR) repeat protein